MAKINEAEVMDALRECYDPEIPVNIVDLGLVYGVEADDETGNVHVTMTLTALGCPLANEVVEEIESAWARSRTSNRARLILPLIPPGRPIA